jgi:hypothetical protein
MVPTGEPITWRFALLYQSAAWAPWIAMTAKRKAATSAGIGVDFMSG